METISSIKRKLRMIGVGIVRDESEFEPGEWIPLPKHVRRAIVCGPKPRVRNWRLLPDEELTRAERVMAFAETYLKVPEGKMVGQPIRLMLFQEAFIYSVFDNEEPTFQAILSMGRKNSKTVTCAIIILAYICGPEAMQNSMLCSGAMSRDQAALIHSHMSKFINLNPELQQAARAVPSGKTVHGIAKNVEFKALAKEGSTTVGRSDLVVVLDEAGQIISPTDSFVEALTSSQGAHEDDAFQIVISTQAPDDKAMLSQWIDDAVSSQDPTIVAHVYASDPDCDLLDKKQWIKSNPALGVFRSEPDLRRQLIKASRLPSLEASARNLLLNQRVAVENPFLTRAVWLSNKVVPDEDFIAEAGCYGGLDLSARNDLTALVLSAQDPDTEVVHIKAFCWTPEDTLKERQKRDKVPYSEWVAKGYLRTTPGSNISYSFIAAELAEIFSQFNVQLCAFDRWRIDVLKENLDREGADHVIEALHPFGQGFKDMAPAVDQTEHLALSSKIAHGDNPVLTWCMSNVIISKNPAGDRKPDKSKSINRIDAAVAFLMSVSAASHYEEDQRSAYTSGKRESGLLVL